MKQELGGREYTKLMTEERLLGRETKQTNQQLEMGESDVIWKERAHLNTNNNVCMSSMREKRWDCFVSGKESDLCLTPTAMCAC